MQLIGSPYLDPRTLNLRGGRLCLDFTNTVDPRAGGENLDYLATYAHLASWAAHAGAVTEEESAELRREGVERPEAAACALAKAIALREAMYRIFLAVSGGGESAPADLETLNEALGDALAHACVAPADGTFAWGWDRGSGDLEWMLWPVARSAAELLTSGELHRLRGCAGEMCGWLFLDASKNRSRRWCNMGVCGNRAKAKRHYARMRSRGIAPTGVREDRRPGPRRRS